MNHLLLVLPLLLACASAQVCRTHLLIAPDPQAGARVGRSIALAGDTIVAGGPYTDNAAGLGGAVYVWRQQAGAWAVEQKIGAPPNQGITYLFGRVVAAHGDRLAIACNPGLNAVWLYRRTGTQWTSGGQLVGSGYLYAANYGEALAVDGEWIAVGAPQAPGAPPLTVRTGAVYLWRDQGGTPVEVAQLRPPTSVLQDEVGMALAMRGGLLVVGSAMGNSAATAGPGAVFVYRIVNDQPVLEATLVSPSASPGSNSLGATFGRAVATDGVRIAVADMSEYVPGGTGAAYVFVQQGGTWVVEGAVTSAAGCGFGERLAIEGDELLVSQACGDRIHHVRRVGGAWVRQWATPSHPAGTFRVAGMELAGGIAVLGSDQNPAPLANAGQVAVHELGAGSVPYGFGLAGSGGFVPTLQGSGCPRVGQPYALELTRALGGSVAVLIAGAAPLQGSWSGGMLWTAPLVETWFLPLGGAPGAAGEGSFVLPLVVPSAAALGASLCFQAIVFDPALAQQLSFSNGIEGVLGQ